LGREKIFQIVLDASLGDMGFLLAASLTSRCPSLGQPDQGFPGRRSLENVLPECLARSQFRKVREVGEEHSPGLHFTLASRANRKMSLHHSLLPGRKLSVQELLDLD
jgi:hypothetical protein